MQDCCEHLNRLARELDNLFTEGELHQFLERIEPDFSEESVRFDGATYSLGEWNEYPNLFKNLLVRAHALKSFGDDEDHVGLRLTFEAQFFHYETDKKPRSLTEFDGLCEQLCNFGDDLEHPIETFAPDVFARIVGARYRQRESAIDLELMVVADIEASDAELYWIVSTIIDSLRIWDSNRSAYGCHQSWGALGDYCPRISEYPSAITASYHSEDSIRSLDLETLGEAKLAEEEDEYEQSLQEWQAAAKADPAAYAEANDWSDL